MAASRWAALTGDGIGFCFQRCVRHKTCYYYVNDEVIFLAWKSRYSYSPSTWALTRWKSWMPGEALVVYQDGSWRNRADFGAQRKKKACSLSAFIFERKWWGNLLRTQSIGFKPRGVGIKSHWFWPQKLFFSYIPNTSEVAFPRSSEGMRCIWTK